VERDSVEIRIATPIRATRVIPLITQIVIIIIPILALILPLILIVTPMVIPTIEEV